MGVPELSWNAENFMPRHTLLGSLLTQLRPTLGVLGPGGAEVGVTMGVGVGIGDGMGCGVEVDWGPGVKDGSGTGAGEFGGTPTV